MVTEAYETLFDALRAQDQHIDHVIGAAVTHCLNQMPDEQVAEVALSWAKDSERSERAAA